MSPRSRLIRVPSSKIPRPNYGTYSLRKETISSKLLPPPEKIEPSGDFSTPTTGHDVNSLTQTQTPSSLHSDFKGHKITDLNSNHGMRLSPLTKEICTLTFKAHQFITPVNTNTVISEWVYPSSSKVEHGESLNCVVRSLQKDLLKTRMLKGLRQNGVIKRRFSFQDTSALPFHNPGKILRARRRSEEIPRIGKETKLFPLRSTSSLRSPLSRRTSVSTTRSPSRCTLRRGRPNTMRAGLGLSRPSPNRSVAEDDLSSSGQKSRTIVSDSMSSHTANNITLNRKGRISRPICVRPGILPSPDNDSGIPPIYEQKENTELNQYVSHQVKNSASFKSRIPDVLPKRAELPVPLPNTSSKLRRVPNFTNIVAHQQEAKNASENIVGNRRGSSCSLRTEMMRSPMKDFLTESKLGSICMKNEVINRRVMSPMKRGLSVQELVRKFDNSGSNENKPNFLQTTKMPINRSLSSITYKTISTSNNWSVLPMKKSDKVKTFLPACTHQVKFNTIHRTETYKKIRIMPNNILKTMNGA